jgi:hypothetical protein
MKNSILLILTVVVVSCSDNNRSRSKICEENKISLFECAASVSNEANSIFNDKDKNHFRKKYIAEVTVPIRTNSKEFIFNEDAKDSDFDQELNCNLEVSNNKRLSFSLETEKLILTDGRLTLIFKRSFTSIDEGLIGSWNMIEDDQNVQTITELIFYSLDELRIRKTCNLR